MMPHSCIIRIRDNSLKTRIGIQHNATIIDPIAASISRAQILPTTTLIGPPPSIGISCRNARLRPIEVRFHGSHHPIELLLQQEVSEQQLRLLNRDANISRQKREMFPMDLLSYIVDIAPQFHIASYIYVLLLFL